MGLWELITGRKRGLMNLSRSELRRRELVLARQRDELLERIDRLARRKQEAFARGAQTRSPEVRQALATQFEALTHEQLLCGRQLNIRSKELLTVSRVRMARQAQEAPDKLGLGRISEADLARLAGMIENDAVTAEVYVQRLDELLAGAAEADRAALGQPSEAASAVLRAWERMDAGAGGDPARAFEDADSQVRSRAARTAAKE